LTAPVLLALAAVGFLVIARGSFRAATVVLLIGLIVLPESLPLPLGPEWLAWSRLMLWTYAVCLFLRAWRGDLPLSLLRPTKVHLVFVFFIAIAFLDGIVLGLQPNPRFESFLGWLTLADQFLVFVVAVAMVRAFGAWWIAKVVAVLALVLGLIAVAERYLHFNWNHFFFLGTHSRLLAGSARLSFRGGEIRVRGPSQFALEFGWVCALLIPLALVVVSRSRSWLVRLLPGLLTLAAVLSISRSALLGIVVGLAAVTFAARDRRVTAIVLVGAAAAFVMVLQSSSLTRPFDRASVDSADSRVRRIATITQDVAGRPLLGLGLAAPRARGIGGTDTSYVLLYAQLGVIGIAAFGVLLLTSFITVAGSVRGPPSRDRSLGAATVATVAVGLIAAASFDHFTIAGSTRVFWLAIGMGVVLNERRVAATSGPPLAVPALRRLVARSGLVVGALAVGIVLSHAVPEHVVWTAEFDTVAPGFTQSVDADPAFIGRVLIDTTCVVVNGTEDLGATVACRQPREAPTIGEMRIEGSDSASVHAAVQLVRRRVQALLPQTRIFVAEPFIRGRPTWARTAPVWMGMAGLALAVLAPRRRARRAGGLPPVTIGAGDTRRTHRIRVRVVPPSESVAQREGDQRTPSFVATAATRADAAAAGV
jgi:hypothetical protein